MNRNRFKRFLFLLRREFLFQLDGRRAHARNIYPGPTWFALICVGAILLEFNSSRLSPHGSHTATEYLSLMAAGLALLIGLRAAIYCAVSFSRDLQSQTASVVQVTPISANAVLVAKLCACLSPMWVELLMFAPIAAIFFSLHLPWYLVLSIFAFLFILSLVGGCVGLAIGSMTPVPPFAARNARILAFYLLLIVPIFTGMSEGVGLPVLGLLLWLILSSRQAPHRAFILGGVSFLSSLVLLDRWLNLSSDASGCLNLHPMGAVQSVLRRLPRSAEWEASILMEAGDQIVPSLAFYAICAGLCFLFARLRYRYRR